jgi:DNA polymerase-3 subunit gamma/tau
MSYQVIARKFRPSSFNDVIGQDAIVKTLKSALSSNRLAHAYLFSGLRGTGKTTLARLLAKAMNCLALDQEANPCTRCASCLEFQAQKTLDFIEIDGASHRGIDDIKNIVDTLTYSSVHRFKIILIDEVHMLTKEAFNALLKTLEEPPAHVKFIFATTEPHKLPSTILSRTQRFDLARIGHKALISKLQKIATTLKVSIDESVLELIAERGEGSLRDAESLFERVIASSHNEIKLDDVYDLLGYFHKDLLEELDHTIKTKALKNVFILADKLFYSGKDVKIFLDQFRHHLRHIVCAKLDLLSFIKTYPLKQSSLEAYTLSEANYLIEVLTEQLKSSYFDKKIEIEALLLHLVQSKHRASLADIIQTLEKIGESGPEVIDETPQATSTESNPKTAAPIEVLEACSAPLPVEETLPLKPPQFYDTVMQFAAIELEGSLKK